MKILEHEKHWTMWLLSVLYDVYETNIDDALKEIQKIIPHMDKDWLVNNVIGGYKKPTKYPCLADFTDMQDTEAADFPFYNYVINIKMWF